MFSRLAIAYKVATVQALLKSMSDGTKAPTDTTISMGLIMVLDEVGRTAYVLTYYMQV